MEMSVKERLLKFIKFKHLTQSAFENSIGAGKSYVNNISKGIGGEKLKRISEEYPELSRDWLLYGEGEMLNTPLSNSAESLQQSKPVYNDSGFSGNSETFVMFKMMADLVKSMAESNRVMLEEVKHLRESVERMNAGTEERFGVLKSEIVEKMDNIHKEQSGIFKETTDMVIGKCSTANTDEIAKAAVNAYMKASRRKTTVGQL